VSKNLSLHLFYVIVNMYCYLYSTIARDVIMGLLIFVGIHHFNHMFSYAQIFDFFFAFVLLETVVWNLCSRVYLNTHTKPHMYD